MSPNVVQQVFDPSMDWSKATAFCMELSSTPLLCVVPGCKHQLCLSCSRKLSWDHFMCPGCLYIEKMFEPDWYLKEMFHGLDLSKARKRHMKDVIEMTSQPRASEPTPSGKTSHRRAKSADLDERRKRLQKMTEQFERSRKKAHEEASAQPLDVEAQNREAMLIKKRAIPQRFLAIGEVARPARSWKHDPVSDRVGVSMAASFDVESSSADSDDGSEASSHESSGGDEFPVSSGSSVVSLKSGTGNVYVDAHGNPQVHSDAESACTQPGLPAQSQTQSQQLGEPLSGAQKAAQSSSRKTTSAPSKQKPSRPADTGAQTNSANQRDQQAAPPSGARHGGPDGQVRVALERDAFDQDHASRADQVHRLLGKPLGEWHDLVNLGGLQFPRRILLDLRVYNPSDPEDLEAVCRVEITGSDFQPDSWDQADFSARVVYMPEYTAAVIESYFDQQSPDLWPHEYLFKGYFAMPGDILAAEAGMGPKHHPTSVARFRTGHVPIRSHRVDTLAKRARQSMSLRLGVEPFSHVGEESVCSAVGCLPFLVSFHAVTPFSLSPGDNHGNAIGARGERRRRAREQGATVQRVQLA